LSQDQKPTGKFNRALIKRAEKQILFLGYFVNKGNFKRKEASNLR
jgi:hypothetical protein